jgi:hypothetical protein
MYVMMRIIKKIIIYEIIYISFCFCSTESQNNIDPRLRQNIERDIENFYNKNNKDYIKVNRKNNIQLPIIIKTIETLDNDESNFNFFPIEYINIENNNNSELEIIKKMVSLSIYSQSFIIFKTYDYVEKIPLIYQTHIDLLMEIFSSPIYSELFNGQVIYHEASYEIISIMRKRYRDLIGSLVMKLKTLQIEINETRKRGVSRSGEKRQQIKKEIRAIKEYLSLENIIDTQKRLNVYQFTSRMLFELGEQFDELYAPSLDHNNPNIMLEIRETIPIENNTTIIYAFLCVPFKLLDDMTKIKMYKDFDIKDVKDISNENKEMQTISLTCFNATQMIFFFKKYNLAAQTQIGLIKMFLDWANMREKEHRENYKPVDKDITVREDDIQERIDENIIPDPDEMNKKLIKKNKKSKKNRKSKRAENNKKENDEIESENQAQETVATMQKLTINDQPRTTAQSVQIKSSDEDSDEEGWTRVKDEILEILNYVGFRYARTVWQWFPNSYQNRQTQLELTVEDEAAEEDTSRGNGEQMQMEQWYYHDLLEAAVYLLRLRNIQDFAVGHRNKQLGLNDAYGVRTIYSPSWIEIYDAQGNLIHRYLGLLEIGMTIDPQYIVEEGKRKGVYVYRIWHIRLNPNLQPPFLKNLKAGNYVGKPTTINPKINVGTRTCVCYTTDLGNKVFEFDDGQGRLFKKLTLFNYANVKSNELAEAISEGVDAYEDLRETKMLQNGALAVVNLHPVIA